MVRVTTPFNPRTFLHREYPEWPVALPGASWGDNFKRNQINLDNLPPLYAFVNDGTAAQMNQAPNLSLQWSPMPTASAWKARLRMNVTAWEFADFPPDFPLPYEWQLNINSINFGGTSEHTARIGLTETSQVGNFQSSNAIQFNFDPTLSGYQCRGRVKIDDNVIYNEQLSELSTTDFFNLQLNIRRDNTVEFGFQGVGTAKVSKTTPPLTTLSPNRRFLVFDFEGTGVAPVDIMRFSSIEWAYR